MIKKLDNDIFFYNDMVFGGLDTDFLHSLAMI